MKCINSESICGFLNWQQSEALLNYFFLSLFFLISLPFFLLKGQSNRFVNVFSTPRDTPGPVT